MLKWLAILGAAIALALALIARLYRLPRKPAQPPEPPRLDGGDTALARMVAALALGPDRASAVQPLREGKAAFAARLALIDRAERSIDVECYIWHRDLTGVLMLDRLRAAADRGVAVRLLLDDLGISGLDAILAELNRHENISVRLYNPFGLRRPRLLNYLFDFVRLNRRMHGKSLTVDGALAITGGRNVGDEYFDTGDEPAFVDLDVIAGGAVVADIARHFAEFWASRSAYRVDRVIRQAPAPSGALDRALAELTDSAEHRRYARELAEHGEARSLAAGEFDLEPVAARLVRDAPDKTLGSVLAGHLMVDDLAAILTGVEHSLDLVSPYFVPGERGMAEFVRLAGRGVRLRVLTNSLAANDVALVHAGYRKYRRRLLEAGIELFELKREASPMARRSDAGALGSRGSSLHAKTFAADGRTVFVGSFNFDPRSVWLNTESGLVIESEAIAHELSRLMEDDLARLAYRVALDAKGRMRWEDLATGAVHHADPGSPLALRAGLWAAGKLPIEWLL
ncbi:phosphatidylserine/phosphatidylglycerophosphate/cardiolipin synthase family protein [Erythrobacter sp. HL-111]|uniref:phospholipase D-like domain-containing protein n=1 Tax=Erythrobacter sp. HL-111 TaxID=1798193 RepID=UPI0006D98E50|nr:phospholipase D family protein [Erythrobacter sp. HL-111]KPP90129.1 MAG: Phosphatidylserine/phosphatidylglycerophosphate/cardiolipin synthase family protein [Erythrobacteraceae bacterium HL-111]SDR81126.1 Phosphatidylserine/phosphatidylglycerophosphate/cardiolipin synthase [Erythrobacter sp. HL-111]